MKTFSAATLLLFTASFAAAHMQWVNPTPRQASSILKDGPCGSALFGASDVTEISPGPLTVTWKNDVAHPGAPFRIALAKAIESKGAQAYAFEECILLDHIPSELNPAIGRYQIVVDIPDVDCEKCVLQLITPSTDKLSATMDSCVYDPLLTNDAADAGNNPRCYSTYHSCADISIKSSGNGGTLTPEKCTEPSDWPFRHGRQILGGNVRTARTSSPRRYYKNEIAVWELRNGSISRHLEDAPERFHGRPDGLNGTDDNENESGGGAGGKVVLWLFILGLAGGLFYIGFKMPVVVAKA